MIHLLSFVKNLLNIFQKFQKKLRITFGCLRRFGQVIGQCEALTPAQTVAERKPHKGAKRRLRFFGARGA